MRESFTAASWRALGRAEARARERGAAHVATSDLLAALLDQPESRAVELLARHGLELMPARAALGLGPDTENGPEVEASGDPPRSVELRIVLEEARLQARSLDRNLPIGTEHLLITLLLDEGPATTALLEAGLSVDDLVAEFEKRELVDSAPISIDATEGALDLTRPSEAIDLARILDASANRAREGLRVIEDYVRFVLEGPMLVRRLKDVRHRLAVAINGLGLDRMFAARDTLRDVGTHISVPTEQVRENPRAVVVANFKRLGESIRSLEEYAKLIDVWLAGRFEGLRYDIYTLEKLVLTAISSHETMGDARLYVLVGGQATLGDLRWVAEEALEGGAHVIQLREKGLDDRELLERAREVRISTARAHARFIFNDRPDLAVLSGADGVHLGQEDLTVRDARRILGAKPIIGVSTHDPRELEKAVLDGAGYVGVGPVFPSRTKDFSHLAGLAFVARAAEEITLPWYALGGIDETNIDQVLAAGATRVAVSSAVTRAASPRAAAAALRARLDALG